MDTNTRDPSAPLPGTLDLGAFSVSLAVADLDASATFYAALGFVESGGDREHHYLILKNGETTLGLFQGMFDANILTFNPGLDHRMQQVEDFTDVRHVHAALTRAGLDATLTAEAKTGPAHVTVTDPDGNSILIDQFF